METFETRDRKSQWVAHEFRVKARETNAWLVKTIGVEALFSKRKGALEFIASSDIPTHWWLRALPDMVLRSTKLTAIVESKWMGSKTDNASAELVQLCILGAMSKMGIPMQYCFGRNDRSGCLEAYVIGVYQLKPELLWLTPRSDKFGLNLEKFGRRLFPQARVSPMDVTRGSNTPFALIPKLQIVRDGTLLDAWLRDNAGAEFSDKERISWEGRDEAKQVWSHIPWERWNQQSG
jgi:hypothetical protein